jgi:hypothetical protein
MKLIPSEAMGRDEFIPRYSEVYKRILSAV